MAGHRRPLVAASAGLFVLVSVAARVPLFGAHSSSASTPPSRVGVVAAAGITAVAVLLTGWLATRRPAHQAARAKLGWRTRAVLIVLPTLVVAAVAVALIDAGRWSPASRGGPAVNRRVQGGAGQRATSPPPAPRPHGGASSLPSGVVVASIAAVVVAFTWLGALVVVRRARPRGETSPDDPGAARDALEQIVATAAVRLEQMDDVRETIINAYAAMSATLGAMGLARRDVEGPREHLGRVLPALGAGGMPAERLERIFERARFTTRPLGPELRTDALAALAGLQASLGGRTP